MCLQDEAVQTKLAIKRFRPTSNAMFSLNDMLLQMICYIYLGDYILSNQNVCRKQNAGLHFLAFDF